LKLAMAAPWLALLAIAAIHTPAAAALEERTVRYAIGGRPYEGFLVLPDGGDGDGDGGAAARPGVLVAHQWMGLGPTERTRARELAAQGFVAFALDMYGVGCRDRPCGPDTMATLNADPEEMRLRARAGLAQLTALPQVDAARIGANGYCFGGTVALELARDGAALRGLVTFHGGLAPLRPDALLPPSAAGLAVQVHTGDLDPITHNDLEPLVAELRGAGVDNWQTAVYGECAHGWTDPANGSFKAREGSEAHLTMLTFYADLFYGGGGGDEAAGAGAAPDHGIYSASAPELPAAAAGGNAAGGGPSWTIVLVALVVGVAVGFAVGKQSADCRRRSHGYEKADLSEGAGD
jgi:dienelactone hydrolase